MNILTIIGAGNMGGAIANALLDKNFCTPESLCIADTSPAKIEVFEKKGCPTSTNAMDFIPESDVIILAVKPQGLPEMLANIQHLLRENILLISLAAGVSVESIMKNSGCQKVVRVMPNTPALLGMGMTGYYASDKVLPAEKEMVQKMLNCFGIAIQCNSEDQINAITALSGSGPAYYFYLLEKTVEQALNYGFSKTQSKEIALQTLRGAGELAYQSEDSFGELREKVTSKGGTTEAALKTFNEESLDTVWEKGITAAYKRAKELSE